MLPPIQILIQLNSPVICANPGCNHIVDSQQNAVFVARHVMVVAYCCPQCYLDVWRRQLTDDDDYRTREAVLEQLGYYQE